MPALALLLVPAGQGRQAVVALELLVRGLYRPAAHERHVAELLAPSVALLVPWGQAWQVGEPGSLQNPRGQQTLAPALLKVRTAQLVQDADALLLHLPAGQVRHTLLLLLPLNAL